MLTNTSRLVRRHPNSIIALKGGCWFSWSTSLVRAPPQHSHPGRVRKRKMSEAAQQAAIYAMPTEAARRPACSGGRTESWSQLRPKAKSVYGTFFLASKRSLPQASDSMPSTYSRDLFQVQVARRNPSQSCSRNQNLQRTWRVATVRLPAGTCRYLTPKPHAKRRD